MQDFVQVNKEAVEFRDSPRGRFITAQALYLGIKALYLYPEPYTEVSNAQDMQYMLDTLHHGMKDLFDQVQPPLTPPEPEEPVVPVRTIPTEEVNRRVREFFSDRKGENNG